MQNVNCADLTRFKMGKIKLLCSVLVLILNFKLVCCQYVQSPCPGTFDYQNDGSNIYGIIVLKPSEPVSQLVVKINLTVAVQLYTNYVGRIEALDDNYVIQKYNQGLSVQYRVHFPVTSPLPKLTALSVNGNLICYGPADVPRPNQYVTTLSLQHTAFLQGGSYSLQPQYQQRPAPVQDLIGQFEDDAKVLTFNNNIDSSPSWNNQNNLNSSVPPTPEPLPVYQHSRPNYEQTTRPSRPSIQVYNDQDLYEQFYDSQPIKMPVYDRNQDTPIQQQPQPPEYEKPTTRSSRPVQEIQRPATTQRSPSNQLNNECGIVSGGNEKIPLVHNGNSYIRGDIPWLVAIYKNKGGALGFLCGGTLVSNRHIVTAAHCMKLRSELTAIRNVIVKLGVHNLNDWGDDITVIRNVIAADIHEKYNSSSLENDIMVLTLSKTVEFNTYIRPACLWSGNTDLSQIVGASGVVAGWGDQGFNNGVPGEPQMVRLPIVSTAMCRASKADFHTITYSSTFCAGDRNGAGPCRGDSGGGLYLLENGKWRLRGVVSVALPRSNAESICDLNEYIIFTDAAQYLMWIRQILLQEYFD